MSTAANRTSFDLWYFDAVSKTTSAAINIVFYNTGDFHANPNPLAVQVYGTFDNGTEFSAQALASGGAVIENNAHGVSGDWKGTGASFRGSNLDKPHVEYEIKFDSPDIGLSGTYRLNTLLLPHLHWANAIPNAQATINLNMNGTIFNITDGIGYHDKNWGDASIITSPKYWDWGHARLGPYSIVRYDLLDYNNTEHVYAYASKDGRVFQTSCARDAVQVRQWGTNVTYPPTFGISKADGLVARFDLGNGQTLVANVTKEQIVHDEIVHEIVGVCDWWD
ncbi:uncharacterized protein N7477_001845 [Penicillium maclennaniae]|uniref:uncharacterized protein n=1 Tax=Penicillium maclennaniae TaxID=1343394 RepID=UPI002540459B|nr:uncharacterized protein N7477_001845 [Penicillium maclennaniae]KAJ5681905.1 hypothetical protein N7477_001845 [Penicillium maclennaniae]